MRGCEVARCVGVVARYHHVTLLGGPDASTKPILAAAFVDVDLTHAGLKARYTLKAGQVWTASGMRIMIRDHCPALFRSMCKSANVHTTGDDTAWKPGGHAVRTA